MNNEDVYCVEDYYLDESGENLHVVLFNTSAFYREVANGMPENNGFDDFLRQQIRRSDRAYDEAILSVDVQGLFEEEVLNARTANMRLFGSRPVQDIQTGRLQGRTL